MEEKAILVGEMEGSAEDISLDDGVTLHGGLEAIRTDQRVKNTRKRRGEVAESVFLAKAISLGLGVAKPWGDSERYDFIVDSGKRLWRVQVKSAFEEMKDGGGYMIRATGSEGNVAYTPEEVDVVVAYIVPEDAWYVIPIEAFKDVKGMKLFPRAKKRRSKHEKYREAWGWIRGD